MQARWQGCCYHMTPARGLDDYLAACRFNNPPLKELAIAAGEQMKITELRLAQLWEGKQAAHARRAGRVLAHVQGAAHWLSPNPSCPAAPPPPPSKASPHPPNSIPIFALLCTDCHLDRAVCSCGFPTPGSPDNLGFHGSQVTADVLSYCRITISDCRITIRQDQQQLVHQQTSPGKMPSEKFSS